MMKKFGVIALATILTAGFATSSVFAEEQSQQPISEKESTTSNYMKFFGKITEIENDKDTVLLTTENEEKELMILRINAESLLFNSGTMKQLKQSTLKKGAEVEAYYDKHKPMTMIYPATVTPELLIVKDADVFGEVKVSKFDENHLSADGELQLNIDDKTILVDQQGKAIKAEDLKGKELVVFYDMTTRSLPPQTTPNKIMALDLKTEETDKVQAIIAEDTYLKNNVKMIPLRKVAEQLGYDVFYQSENGGVLITKENMSFTIKFGDQMYGYNKSLGKFEIAPEIKDLKTYVSPDFLEQLEQN